MESKTLNEVNQAFSKADTSFYDSYGSDNIITWARNVVYQHIFKYLSKKDRILDIAAGTGADALFLAKLGYKVHATDLSDGMISALQNKVENLENPATKDRISYEQISFTEIDNVSNTPYDFVLSNFGGLNCVPDVSLVSEKIKKILKPGGIMTWVIMPPICPWEVKSIFTNKEYALRRFSRSANGGVDAKIKDAEFTAYYFTPKQVMESIGSDFIKLDLQGLCIFTPPLYKDEEHFSIRHPKLFKLLKLIDSKISHIPPFNSWGDFFIISFRYQPQGGKL